MIRVGLFFLASVALVACGKEEPFRPSVAVTLEVSGDEGSVLEGIPIQIDGRELGRTDVDGLFQVVLRGIEGTTKEIVYTCPEGTVGDEEPLRVRMMSLEGDDGVRVLTRRLACHRVEHRVAFVVKADAQADLPVLIGRTVVARTNANGYAHIVVRTRPRREFRLSFDTEAREELQPQNPSRAFEAPARNAVLVYDQEFETYRRQTRRRRRRRPGGMRRSSMMSGGSRMIMLAPGLQ